MPVQALLGRCFKPCIVGNSVPAPHQLFGDLEDHHQRFLPLQQMDERHPRVLADIVGFQIGQKQASHAQIFPTVPFPQGWDEFRQRPFPRGVREHPRGNLSQVWERCADVKPKTGIRHGDICPWFVGEITYTDAVCLFEKAQTPPL